MKIKLSTLNIVTVLIVGIVIFTQGVALVYFANKTKSFSEKMQEMKSHYYDNMSKTEQDAQNKYQEVTNKYNALLKENGALKEDRNNLLVKTKSLLVDSGKAKELEEILVATKKKMTTMNDELISLREETRQQGKVIKKISKERDSIKAIYEKAVKVDVVKKLKKELTSIKDENNKIVKNLKQENKKITKNLKNANKNIKELTKKLTKFENDNINLTQELKQYKENYKEATQKIKAMDKEMRRGPRKIAKLAQQNKELIKEGARRHYNLGVFYTKQKEYERAIREFEKALDINPNNSDTHFNLGYIYAEYLQNREKAVEHFRYFLKIGNANDKDIDWVKRYLLIWQTYEGKQPIE